jgi:hypothetical protein
MATANKTPPMIAPGIVCPKCKGACTDERANKRTDKSPDYLCANVLCTDKTGKYRTGVWIEKGNGSGAEQSAGGGLATGTNVGASLAEPAATEKPKLTKLYLDATEFVLEKIVPLYEAKEIGVSDTAIGSMVATLFIAGSKER